MRTMRPTEAEVPVDPDAEFRRRVDEVVARLVDEEDRERREKAECEVLGVMAEEARGSRTIDEWGPILERAGLTAVRAAWPDCPVPTYAGNPVLRVDPYQPLAVRKPWLLTDEGVRYCLDIVYQHGRQWFVPASYLVCGPLFQIARPGSWGLGARYAIRAGKAGAKWKIVDMPGPRQHAMKEYPTLAATPGETFTATAPTESQVIDRLLAAGLWVNPVDAEHHAGGGVSGEHNVFAVKALELLATFLRDHQSEAPIRTT